jgi:hypothetical protein
MDHQVKDKNLLMPSSMIGEVFLIKTLCKDFTIQDNLIGLILIGLVLLELVMEDIWLIGFKVILMHLSV